MRIEQAKPSDILAKIEQGDRSISELILKGYDLKINAQNNPVEAIEFEYNYTDKRGKVFLAIEESGDVVGTLTLLLWRDEPTDKRGHEFFSQLRVIDSAMAERLADFNPLICDVAGVVVKPDYRGQGIAQKLLIEAISALNPALIIGQTKTIGAVIARSKLDKYGYRTFYGEHEVTFSNPRGKSNKHLSLYQAYCSARGITNLSDGFVHEYTGGIAPTVPDVNGFPDHIAESFQPVVKAQNLMGSDGGTAMAVLMSVRNEVVT